MESTHTPNPWNKTLERCQEYSSERGLGGPNPQPGAGGGGWAGSAGIYQNILDRGV